MNPFNNPPFSTLFKKAPENKTENKMSLKGVATIGALLVILGQDAKVFAAPNENSGENTIEMTAPVTSRSHLEKMKSLGSTVEVNFSNRTTLFENEPGEITLTVTMKDNGAEIVYTDSDKDGDVDFYKRTGGGIDVHLDLHANEFTEIKEGKISEENNIDYIKTAENIQETFHTEISNLDKVEHSRKAKLAALELEKKNKGILTAQT